MNKHISYLIFSLLVLVGMDSHAQTELQAIHFDNVKYNKSSYLLYQLKTEIGKPIDINSVEQDVKTLNSLPSVAKTTYRIDTTSLGTELNFEIEEAVTSFPLFNVGLIEDNVWFSAGYGGLNLFGRGHQLKGIYQYSDNKHNFDLFYKVPNWGKTKWGNSFSVSKYGSLEPLFFDEGTVFYDYDIRTVTSSLSYRLKPNHTLEFGASFFREEYEKAEVQNLDFTPGPDFREENKVLFKLKHTIRDIEYNYYQLNGWESITTLQSIRNLTDGSKFQNFVYQINGFKTIGKKGNFAARLRFGLANNSDSPFAPFVVDSYINIRGVGNRVDRGTAQLILNMEYRHRIFHKKRFAGQVVAFSDQGNWRNPGGELDDLINFKNYIHFVGAGVRLIYIKGYNFILRADYGVNVSTSGYNGNGFVLGVGQYF